MSRYDKTVAISREEEGTYHRREYEHSPARPPVTTTYETYTVPATVKTSKSLSRRRQDDGTSGDDDDDNFEEWTTSKKKVNHKTRQVETRVSRQLLVEDGKVIADSGPQVTTRIKEDNKLEECEKEKTPKNKSRFEALENAPEAGADGCSGRVLGEKKEIQRVSREVREENLQYHDERFKELTGHDVHRKAIKAPHELITINDSKSHDSAPRGKMVHYSNKGKKYQDTDEILEVAKLAIDGSITKEVKRTKHHEEFSEDEQPDEKGEAEALRNEPIVTRSSRRHVDYVNDFDDTATPSCTSDDDDDQVDHRATSRQHKKQHHSSNKSHHKNRHHHHHHHQRDDEAFPRYQIDPLLNSLRDEDYRPPSASAGRQVEHSLERKDHNHTSSSDYDHHRSARVRTASPVAAAAAPAGAVEIPEEYRVNKHKLLSSKSGARERSFSPQQRQHKSSQSHHRSANRLHREDAGVQARLTDEEVERRSVKSSSSSAISHEKQTRHLQRQSTANSSRNYYYGDRKHQRRQRKDSVSSSSSSASISDPKERMRQHGTRSRDSGFKSPQSGAASPQQIYSVSGKSRRRGDGAMSPTLSQASAGQRSVKTTTTTMSAGLADRPLSRNARSAEPTKPARSRDRQRQQQQQQSGAKKKYVDYLSSSDELVRQNNRQQQQYNEQQVPVVVVETNDNLSPSSGRAFDTVSLSSLGPNATTIKVPYRRVIEVEQQHTRDDDDDDDDNGLTIERVDGKQSVKGEGPERRQRQRHQQDSTLKDSTASEMSFQEDIQSLSKRLDEIRRKPEAKSAIKKKTTTTDGDDDDRRQQFDYKTIIKNIEPIGVAPPKQQHVINAYNVRVIEQRSPFVENDQAPKSHYSSNLADGLAQIEIRQKQKQPPQQGNQVLINVTNNNNNNNNNPNYNSNNNEPLFNLNDYVKYRAIPVLVDSASVVNGGASSSSNMDYDRMSLGSSCSLQSSKTYNISTIDALKSIPIRNDEQKETKSNDKEPLEHHEQDQDATSQQQEDVEDGNNQPVFDENGNSKQPTAWVFDPIDGSSTAIAAPSRPKRPETPKIDSKTEELVQARGGRSYYLELVDPSDKAAKRQRPSSIDSLYSRWNSQGALNHYNGHHADSTRYNSRQVMASKSSALNLSTPADQLSKLRRSRQMLPTSKTLATTKPVPSRPTTPINNLQQAQSNQQTTTTANRRQLPFGGPPNLGNRSRSSSCLLTVTKPSKYSIYGGFRRPGENNKPVPRLSYSRAIGPKSQRQLDAQSKTPSRYLKMK